MSEAERKVVEVAEELAGLTHKGRCSEGGLRALSAAEWALLITLMKLHNDDDSGERLPAHLNSMKADEKFIQTFDSAFLKVNVFFNVLKDSFEPVPAEDQVPDNLPLPDNQQIFHGPAESSGSVDDQELGVLLKKRRIAPMAAQPLDHSHIGPAPNSELGRYVATASELLEGNYYQGLISVVESCLKDTGAFVIIDGPSGHGKTLAAVALTLLDKKGPMSRSLNSKKSNVRLLIWNYKVPVRSGGGQRVYDDIVAHYKINDNFFQKFNQIFNDRLPEDSRQDFLKQNLLTTLELGSDPFKDTVVLIIDEVPNQPEEVVKLGVLRDSLKSIENLCLILCGTNSKASNMVGLSQNAISSKTEGRNSVSWALIVTRLPRFVLGGESESLWQEICDHPEGTLICNVIASSMKSGGNSRLIIFALEEASNVLRSRPRQTGSTDAVKMISFLSWHTAFHEKFRRNKFDFSSASMFFNFLVGQLNLLLSASATSALSDVLIGYHLAHRAKPDSVRFFSERGCNPTHCAGFLHVAATEHRARGSSLLYAPMSDPPASEGSSSWQTTIFPSPNQDLLLYFAACFGNGYFNISSSRLTKRFKACEVVPHLWSSNAAGFVNFQNPKAVHNSCFMLEVLMAVGVSNAAALGNFSQPCIAVCSNMKDFIQNFSAELGIVFDPRDSLLQEDTELCKIYVPKFVVPADRNFLEHCRGLGLNGTVGISERQPNMDGFDLLLTWFDCNGALFFVRFEAKDRQQFHTGEMCIAVAKLMMENVKVGVIAVRKCTNYWGDTAQSKKNRTNLERSLRIICKIGTAYLISRVGEVQVVVIDQKRQERLIIIQVPDASLNPPESVRLAE